MTGMGGRSQTGGLEGSEGMRPEEGGWYSIAVIGGSPVEKMVGATQDLPGRANMAEQQKSLHGSPRSRGGWGRGAAAAPTRATSNGN